MIFFIDNLIMFVEILRTQKANKNKKVFWGVLSIHRTCHRGFIQCSLYLRGKNHIMSLLKHYPLRRFVNFAVIFFGILTSIDSTGF